MYITVSMLCLWWEEWFGQWRRERSTYRLQEGERGTLRPWHTHTCALTVPLNSLQIESYYEAIKFYHSFSYELLQRWGQFSCHCGQDFSLLSHSSCEDLIPVFIWDENLCSKIPYVLLNCCLNPIKLKAAGARNTLCVSNFILNLVSFLQGFQERNCILTT